MGRKWHWITALLMVGLFASLGSARPVDDTGEDRVSVLNTQPGPGQFGVCVGSDCSLVEGQLVGSQTQSFSLPIESNGEFGAFQQTVLGGEAITVGLGGNVDPTQTLAFGAVDVGAPSTFAVAISVPLVPTINGLADFSLTLFGDCTDGGTNGCSISPFLSGPGISEYFVNGFTTSLGIRGEARSLPTPGSDFLGQPFGTISGTIDCAALGGCTSFETLLSFTGSGGSDAFSFTTRFDINAAAVPEPSTVSLLGLGLLGMGFAAIRRRRS
ncbi:MAG: PEP-CTERM sorting domain-containing protein [Candidatus Tectimicrobiota bacterium]